MLITALLALLAALLLFLSGRLILAFLPPGWPGFAPGMGTRELGATIGASWILGSLVLQLCALIANLCQASFHLDMEPVLTGFAVGYIGVHALLVVALVLRAPAKLRPRHEGTHSRPVWIVRMFALALLALVLYPALIDGDVVRAEAQAFGALTSPNFVVRWMLGSGGSLAPLALTLVLVGALQQLALRGWVAWLVGLGCVASFLAAAGEFLQQPPDNGEVTRLPVYALLVASVVGLVWARRADRRARAFALLLLAMLPLVAGIAALPAALIGLSIVLFALPAGGRLWAWPWALVIALSLMQLAVRWLMREYHWRTSAPELEIEQFFAFDPPDLAPEGLEDWRLWLSLPVILVIAVWFQAHRSRADRTPYETRVSWALVALLPIAFLSTGWFFHATLFSTPVQESWTTIWRFDLSDVVLTWVPALLVLVALHFGPREERATSTAAERS